MLTISNKYDARPEAGISGRETDEDASRTGLLQSSAGPISVPEPRHDHRQTYNSASSCCLLSADKAFSLMEDMVGVWRISRNDYRGEVKSRIWGCRL
jgi:hypothetical protein